MHSVLALIVDQVVFTGLGVRFVRNMFQVEAHDRIPSDKTGWRLQMFSIFTVLVLITVSVVFMLPLSVLTSVKVRIIFRLIEFTKGFEPGNQMLFNEAYVYCLDASPMFLALLLLSVVRPGRVLVAPESEFPRLSRREKKMMKQEKKVLKREKEMEKRSNGNRFHADTGVSSGERGVRM